MQEQDGRVQNDPLHLRLEIVEDVVKELVGAPPHLDFAARDRKDLVELAAHRGKSLKLLEERRARFADFGGWCMRMLRRGALIAAGALVPALVQPIGDRISQAIRTLIGEIK